MSWVGHYPCVRSGEGDGGTNAKNWNFQALSFKFYTPRVMSTHSPAARLENRNSNPRLPSRPGRVSLRVENSVSTGRTPHATHRYSWGVPPLSAGLSQGHGTT